MKISQIRAIHREYHRRDLAAMENFLGDSGKLWEYHHSKYKTMRMFLRHVYGIECVKGKIIFREDVK